MEKVIAVSIPIVIALVAGIVIVTAIFLKSRERQLLIEKGLSAEDIKEFYSRKKDHYILMKIGVVVLFFGLGLGLGLILKEETSREYWVPFLLFTITGLGFVAANLISRRLEAKVVE
jgi:hypothetical protein